MRVLAVAEFDAAGVLSGHRRALRALGIDYRIAIVDRYLYRSDLEHDWPLADGSIAGLREFAATVDVLQFHPSIGQPWSYQTTNPRLSDDGENAGLFGIDWTVIPAVRVSLFHGSRNAAANAERYADFWRSRDHAIWATTLDYVVRMEASYAPPALFLDGPRAPLRTDDDPLIAIQCPTDPAFCHTAEFLKVCAELGIVADVVHGKPHTEALARKRAAHVGFDHLRGAFSVNTLENCALGLAPVVGLKRAYRERLHDLTGVTFLPILEDVGDLRTLLRRFADDPGVTRRVQEQARGWFTRHFKPELVGYRLKKLYEGLL